VFLRRWQQRLSRILQLSASCGFVGMCFALHPQHPTAVREAVQFLVIASQAVVPLLYHLTVWGNGRIYKDG
jgi:hypothetical protein